jgi:hypothetical protein
LTQGVSKVRNINFPGLTVGFRKYFTVGSLVFRPALSAQAGEKCSRKFTITQYFEDFLSRFYVN